MLVHTLFALDYFIHSLSPINVDSQDVAQIMRVHSFTFSAPYGNCLECLSKLNIYHSLRLSLSLHSTLHTPHSPLSSLWRSVCLFCKLPTLVVRLSV